MRSFELKAKTPENMSHMQELILLSAHLELNKTQVDEFSKLLGLGWPDPNFIDLLEANGVHCLFYHHIKSLCLEGLIDEAEMSSLKARYLNQVFKQEMLTNAADEVIVAFKENEIHPIAIKAHSLHGVVYPKPELRPAGDIDLVVLPKAIPKVKEIMASLGFSPLVVIDDQYFEITYQKNIGVRILIEISTGIHEIREYENFLFPKMSQIWERCVSGPESCYRLSLEDEFQQLVTHHLTTHYLRKAIWLCDLGEFLKTVGPNLNWGIVVDRFAACRQLKALALVLFLVENHFPQELPSQDLNKVLSSDLKSLYHGPKSILGFPWLLEKQKNKIRYTLIDGVWGKSLFFLKRLLPDGKWLTKRYDVFPLVKVRPIVLVYHWYQMVFTLLKSIIVK